MLNVVPIPPIFPKLRHPPPMVLTGLREAETPLTSLSQGWGAGAGAQAQSCQTTNTSGKNSLPAQLPFVFLLSFWKF